MRRSCCWLPRTWYSDKWTVEFGELGALLGGLADQELPVHLDLGRRRALGRMEVRERIAALGEAACNLAISSWAAMRSALTCPCSAAVMVGSSSIRLSPARTGWPSWTLMARTTPVSSGWISLVL